MEQAHFDCDAGPADVGEQGDDKDESLGSSWDSDFGLTKCWSH